MQWPVAGPPWKTANPGPPIRLALQPPLALLPLRPPSLLLTFNLNSSCYSQTIPHTISLPHAPHTHTPHHHHHNNNNNSSQPQPLQLSISNSSSSLNPLSSSLLSLIRCFLFPSSCTEICEIQVEMANCCAAVIRRWRKWRMQCVFLFWRRRRRVFFKFSFVLSFSLPF